MSVISYEKQREQVWEDYMIGRISQERADEMLRTITYNEIAEANPHARFAREALSDQRFDRGPA